MTKNSTIKLWDYLFKEDYLAFDKSVHQILTENQLKPKNESIDNILAYASSVKGIRTKSIDKVLISLN